MAEATLEKSPTPSRPIEKYRMLSSRESSPENSQRAFKTELVWQGREPLEGVGFEQNAELFLKKIEDAQAGGGLKLVPEEYFNIFERPDVRPNVQEILDNIRQEGRDESLQKMYERIIGGDDKNEIKQKLAALKIVGAGFIESGNPGKRGSKEAITSEQKDQIRFGEMLVLMSELGAIKSEAAQLSGSEDEQRKKELVLVEHFQSAYRNRDIADSLRSEIAEVLLNKFAYLIEELPPKPPAPSSPAPATPAATTADETAPPSPAPPAAPESPSAAPVSPDQEQQSDNVLDDEQPAPGPDDTAKSSAAETVVSSPKKRLQEANEKWEKSELERQEIRSKLNLAQAKWEWLQGGIWPKKNLNPKEKNAILESRIKETQKQLSEGDALSSDPDLDDKLRVLEIQREMLLGTEQSNWVNQVNVMSDNEADLEEQALATEMQALLQEKRKNAEAGRLIDREREAALAGQMVEDAAAPVRAEAQARAAAEKAEQDRVAEEQAKEQRIKDLKQLIAGNKEEYDRNPQNSAEQQAQNILSHFFEGVDIKTAKSWAQEVKGWFKTFIAKKFSDPEKQAKLNSAYELAWTEIANPRSSLPFESHKELIDCLAAADIESNQKPEGQREIIWGALMHRQLLIERGKLYQQELTALARERLRRRAQNIYNRVTGKGKA